MRETGQSACTIVFCDGHVYVEPAQAFAEAPHSARAPS
jgi:prepilin-type processing-associated H-X9-DG protein